jgi:small-conductance mechanosensitive channel
MVDQIEDAVGKAVQDVMNQQLRMQSGITSLLVIAGILALRYFLSHLIKGKSEILDKEQRRWLNRINNGTGMLIVISLIFIWAPQIHTFALSLTAVAVAVVLTTKELLMCLTGGFLRATSKPFDVGDWITVDGFTGEVMRITALATMVEEIDTQEKTYQYTGRTIQIPNSRFLTVNVENANFIKDYVYYDVPIAVQYNDLDPVVLMDELKKISQIYYAAFKDEAVKFNQKVEKKAAVDFADPEPQLFLKTTELGHNLYTVRMFMPTKLAAQVSADMTRDFLKYVYDQKIKKEET